MSAKNDIPIRSDMYYLFIEIWMLERKHKEAKLAVVKHWEHPDKDEGERQDNEIIPPCFADENLVFHEFCDWCKEHSDLRAEKIILGKKLRILKLRLNHWMKQELKEQGNSATMSVGT